MLALGMVQKLNVQMNLEYNASNRYLRLSEWCAKRKLTGTAIFLRSQAQINVTRMMRVFDFIKKSGANPVVATTNPIEEQCTNLEELFSQTMMDFQHRSETLTKLIEEARSQNDAATLAFLTQIATEREEHGLLLQTIFEEVRHAGQAGMKMEQTDQHLLNVVNYQQH
ncbi:non-heme ferritin-like protein [Superficieibacter sp. HKU1]|uniref:non-heme ferritin-like protein n=1 Tax=Superficieibacter sp. HKU1 TaxID=3031919 RepID=UPI0023E090E7|nr:non-heme ferritin-like protein [Superficieibacter sp. HKU1]WES66614.1 non-heme ferritin-like protein [Superficieibacter sp. HKU1]